MNYKKDDFTLRIKRFFLNNSVKIERSRSIIKYIDTSFVVAN